MNLSVMVIDILTIFPGIVQSAISESLLGKAIQERILEVNVFDLREFADDRHRTVDDSPFGGGAGMVMKVEPIYKGVRHCCDRNSAIKHRVLFTSASGRRLDQPFAEELSRETHIVIMCGRYKGVDERAIELLGAEEVSIGDYVLTGGELPALVIVESTARLLPGYMSKIEAAETDSYTTGLLGYPEYTRPQEFMGKQVPEVLISGHHDNIRRYRRTKSIEKTLRFRPDLVTKAKLSDEDRSIINEITKRELT